MLTEIMAAFSLSAVKATFILVSIFMAGLGLYKIGKERGNSYQKNEEIFAWKA